jgi:hypothetical protein
MRGHQRVALTVLVLALTGLVGCFPPRTVWLPDSSGFVFSSAGPWDESSDTIARIFHYDLNKKAARVLTDVPWLSTMMPGVSPDGKRVALVRVERAGQRSTAQVVFVDLDTGRLHQTKPVAVGELKTEGFVPWAVAEWSPKGDHLLIAVLEERNDSSSMVPVLGIYDLKTEMLKFHSDLRLMCFDRPLGGSIAGDGSGFLACSWNKSLQIESNKSPHKTPGSQASSSPLETVVFVDWNGRKHDLMTTPEVLAPLNECLTEHRDELCSNILLQDSTLQGRWEGPVAALGLSRGVIRIDCARYTINYQTDARPVEERPRAKGEKLVASSRLANGDVVVEVIALEPPVKPKNEYDRLADRVAALESKLEVVQHREDDWDLAHRIFGARRIDVWIPKMRERRALVENATKVSMSRAPDGRKLAIRYSPVNDCRSSAERILVIDDRGGTIADFAIEKPARKRAFADADRPGDAAQGGPRGPLIDREAERAAWERRHAKALAADPFLRDDLEASMRYFSACTAVLIGSGGPPTDEAERARQRCLALDWLKLDLALWKRQLESGTPACRNKVKQLLRHWNVDRDLAGIRDPERLARLPDAEQKTWRALWADVAALEKKADGNRMQP